MQAIDINVKKWMESEAYIKQKGIISSEINKHKIEIDYSCFRKTPQERLDIYAGKQSYKSSLGHLKK